VISYSRRYNCPNENPFSTGNHSAHVEAEDLLAFIGELRLDHVHLVGFSAGALTALVFAVQHREIASSLVLAEPPVHQWVKDVPGGKVLYREFMTKVWEPATKAFQQGDTVQAMRVFVDGLSSARRFDQLAPEARSTIMRNARAIEALTRSSDPFPNLSKSKIRKLLIPSLIVTGENTIRIHKLVNEELARLLPNAKAVVIPKAGHGSPRDNPKVFNAMVLGFLVGIRK
jgi:pimeloyl-ACP methyl ester carboxylesterase